MEGYTMKHVLTMILIAALALSACAETMLNETNETAGSLPEVTEPEMPEPMEPEPMEPEPMEPEPMEPEPMEPEMPEVAEPVSPDVFTITRKEGDLIELEPEAVDPDGDEVVFLFSEPFDREGRWQTGAGDAGIYEVAVTAQDEMGAESTVEILLIVEAANQPPMLSCPERIVVREGELVRVDCDVSDPEDDALSVQFSGWMTGSVLQTTYDDAGEHAVTVTASDGQNRVTEEVMVVVQDVNRAPVFPLDFPVAIVASEGEIVTIETGDVYDPDGDTVAFTFSKPLDESGIWRTETGDAGVYNIDVIASDGALTAKRRVTLEIEMVNTPPVLKRIADITVSEGDRVEIPLEATDREGDELSYEITGWLDEPTYTTTYDDAGTYTTKVTVSDGEFTDSQIVTITVVDKNRPPVFRVPA